MLSDAQKSAGNYRKKHIECLGLKISIETPKGSMRTGTDHRGRRWSVKMPVDYGYIRSTEGADGDHVDCYVGPRRNAKKVFVIDQKDHITNKFDEHKCMLCFGSMNEAVNAYDRSFSDGKGMQRIAAIVEMTEEQFCRWLKSDTTRPYVKRRADGGRIQKIVNRAQQLQHRYTSGEPVRFETDRAYLEAQPGGLKGGLRLPFAEGGVVEDPVQRIEDPELSQPFVNPLPPPPEKSFLEMIKEAPGAGLMGITEALEGQYKPENARFINDAGQWLDESMQVIEPTRRPTILPATRDPNTGEVQAAMPSFLDVMNTLGNPFAAAKGATLGAGLVRPAAKAAPDVPFYSKIEQVVEDSGQQSAPGDQWANWLKSQPGVKQEEIDWLGLDDFLGPRPHRKYTREEILKHIDENRVQLEEKILNKPDWAKVEEVVKNPEDRLKFWEEVWDEANEIGTNRVPKYGESAEFDDAMRDQMAEEMGTGARYREYQVPGGENYQEMLLTLTHKPVPGRYELRPPTLVDWARKKMEQAGTLKDFMKTHQGIFNRETGYHVTNVTNIDAEETLSRYNSGGTLLDDSNNFQSSHWGEPNVLAHVRFNDRNIDGGRSLFLEELQSDWHQKGKMMGYGQAHGAVPDAPFKKTWPELSLKRMIHKAAQDGYDSISWTTGAIQADRYNLAKQVDEIQVIRTGEDSYRIAAMPINDTKMFFVGPATIPSAKLEDYIGKDLARKVVGNAPNIGGDQIFRGTDLHVGGEGMKGFYDKILPSVANKLGKKYGATVQTSKMDTETSENGLEVAMDPTRTENGFYVYGYKGSESYVVKEGFQTREDAVAWRNKNLPDTREDVHVLPITPELRAAALGEGFSLFSKSRPQGMAGGMEKQFSPYFQKEQLRSALNEFENSQIRTYNELRKGYKLRGMELEAATDYLNDSAWINDYLRKGKSIRRSDLDHVKFLGFDDVDDYIRAMDRATSSYTLPREIRVFRGLREGGKGLVQGKTYMDPAFLSTTMSFETANEFLGGPRSSAIVEIVVPKKYKVGFPPTTDEDEIILPRGTKIKLEKISTIYQESEYGGGEFPFYVGRVIP